MTSRTLITEREWMRTVTDALTLYGWRWTHFRPAMTAKGYRTPLSGSPGFPDIVAVKDGRLLFIELKADKGRVTPTQREWIWDLQEVHGETRCYVWRPSDFDAISEVLK